MLSTIKTFKTKFTFRAQASKVMPLLITSLLMCGLSKAQTTGDYRSIATGNWSVASTWERFNGTAFVGAPAAPGSSDGVITIRTGNNVTVNTGVTVDQVIVNAGGTLTQTSTLSVVDGVGDDVTVNGSYIFLGGTLNGAGVMKVNGNMDWQTGSLQGNLVLNSSAISTKSTVGAAIIQGNGVLTNNGTLTWSGGDFGMGNGTFNNGTTGLITISGDNQLVEVGGATSFSNEGTITKSTGTGTTTIAVNGSNTGTINVTTGIITSSRAFTNSGNINAGSGKKFQVSGGTFTLNTGSHSTGAGNFEFLGGTLTVNAASATATKFLFTGGTMNGSGTLTVSSGMDWQTGSLQGNLVLNSSAVSTKSTVGAALIQGNGVVTNNGTLTWSDGNFGLGNGTFNNGTTGLITITGNNQLVEIGGATSFNNAGTITKNTGTGTTTIAVNGSNIGTINVITGIITSSRAFINAGTINAASGQRFQVSGGTFTLNTGSNSTGAGNFELLSGTLTVNALASAPATASNYLFTGGTMNGSGTLKVNAGMDWQTGSLQSNLVLNTSAVSTKSTAGGALIQGNGVLTNNGALTWSDGNFGLGNGTFNNGTTGLITITGNNQLVEIGGATSFNNAGTITKSIGTGTTTIAVNGSNSGTLNVTTGIITSSRAFINSGNINAASGQRFQVSGGTFTLNTGSNSTGAGNFEFLSGTLTVNALAATPATASNYLFTGGTMNGLGTLKVNAGMDWQTGSLQSNLILNTSAVSTKSTAGGALIQGNGVLTNNGALTWSDGNFGLGNGTFNNGATGLITVTGNNQLVEIGGATNFSNEGTITKSTGTGTTTIAVNGSNAGTINVTTGIITSSRAFINSGNMNAASGQRFQVSGGTFTLNTGSNSTGAGNFELLGGTLTVNAPVVTPATASNYLFTGGTMNGSGTLLVTGGMDWQIGSLQNNVVLNTSAVSTKSTVGAALIQGNGVLTNNGTFTWSDGDFGLGNGTFNNGTTGLITITGNNQLVEIGGATSFSNAGTITKSTATGTTTIAVNCSNAGTIKGIGTYNFTRLFTDTGTIAPGLSQGLLTVNGTQPFSANSTLAIEMFDGSGAGTGHDQLIRDGSLTLAGTLTVIETGLVPAGTYTIVNLTTGTISGTFSTTNLPNGYTLIINTQTVQLTKCINATPVISTSGATTFCVGNSVTLTSSAANGNLWSNGATTQSIVVSASGSFTVQKTGNQACATSFSSAPKTVTVNPLPAPPTVSANGPTTFCTGGSVILTSNATTGNLWSTGATTQSITVSTSGSFTVTRTNANGCTSSSSVAKVITVNPLPAKPTISANGPTTFCSVSNVILTSSAATGNLWSTGATTKSITVSTAGSFTVKTTNANGCTSANSLPTTTTVITATTFFQDADGDGFGNAAVSQQACSAPVGFVSNNTDCNDNNAAIKPGATEICNGIDDNCNGTIDEGCGGTFTYFRDLDGDGFGDAANSITSSSATPPAGFVVNSTDCNDNNAAIKPGATEVCNGIDDNCNGTIDEGVKTTFFRDLDGDGFGNPASTKKACSQPAGYVANNTDCNDNNAAVNPGATEVCNGIDDNCNGTIDEGVKTTFFQDADGDGFGNAAVSQQACSAPVGFVTDNTDCNDNNPAIKPGATEICNGIDDNCNGTIDEGCGSTFTYFRDLDGDGFGDAANSITSSSATPPAGFVVNSTDCNDNNAAIKPGATEVCNGIDDNCNGSIDEGVKTTFFRDLDGDGFGNPASTKKACSQPVGYVANNTDCNDNNANVNPGATELCNGIDDNCNGTIDEGVKTTFFQDADGDGFGNAAVSQQACSAPVGFVTDNTDCNDNNPGIKPGATEICNGIDDNCNGIVDDGFPSPVKPTSITGVFTYVCGTQQTYTALPNNANSTYLWTGFPAGTTIVSQSGNTITVNFPSSGFTSSLMKVRTKICAKMSANFTKYVYCVYSMREEQINASTNEKEAIVYPNTSSGIFNVDFSSMDVSTATVRIMDMQGKILIEQSYNEPSLNEKSFDLTSYQEGVYVMAIISDYGTQTIRLMKLD